MYWYKVIPAVSVSDVGHFPSEIMVGGVFGLTPDLDKFEIDTGDLLLGVILLFPLTEFIFEIESIETGLLITTPPLNGAIRTKVLIWLLHDVDTCTGVATIEVEMIRADIAALDWIETGPGFDPDWQLTFMAWYSVRWERNELWL